MLTIFEAVLGFILRAMLLPGWETVYLFSGFGIFALAIISLERLTNRF